MFVQLFCHLKDRIGHGNAFSIICNIGTKYKLGKETHIKDMMIFDHNLLKYSRFDGLVVCVCFFFPFFFVCFVFHLQWWEKGYKMRFLSLLILIIKNNNNMSINAFKHTGRNNDLFRNDLLESDHHIFMWKPLIWISVHWGLVQGLVKAYSLVGYYKKYSDEISNLCTGHLGPDLAGQEQNGVLRVYYIQREPSSSLKLILSSVKAHLRA